MLTRISHTKENKEMGDDLSKRGAQDRDRINIHEQWEVNYWTDKFGISREKLEEAVKTVGTMAKDVENYLKRAA